MKLKLSNGRAALQSDIDTLQRSIGMPITSEFLAFVAVSDGAEPETNIFKVGETNESGVNRFIPIKEIIAEMSGIRNLPKTSFPVAWAEGGNYVFINQSEKGAVYFWDHEQPRSSTNLAGSFRSFLDSLEPFDIKAIKLKPGQVKKAWIDPEFLKMFQG